MPASQLTEHLLSRLAAATVDTEPWPHGYLTDALPVAQASALSGSFERLDMEYCEETRRDKSYRFRTLHLSLASAGELPGGAWEPFLGTLFSKSYRRLLSDLTGIPLESTELTVNAWEYRSGDWLAPHVDKADKVVTQIFYLTPEWQPGNGGRLLIMASADPPSAVRALPPQLGSSAVLVRSERSWHAVEPPGPGSASRRSVTATFWEPARPLANPGRPDR